MKILLVEDEKELLNSLSTSLKREGFLCETAWNQKTAEEKLSIYKYDLVILDITLPDGNGLNLLSQLKTDLPETGVLIVSAKNSLDDKLKGLDLGADDYLTKPFHFSELNSRINAIIRRRNFNGSSKLNFFEISIDLIGKTVNVNEHHLDLTKKEYDLLLYFITNKNRVLTKEGIAEHLWGDHADMADNFDFIYTHIKNLRKKIEAEGGQNYLKTIYGVGYKYSDQ
jgi:DNA-binding response OmpR family regulator